MSRDNPSKVVDKPDDFATIVAEREVWASNPYSFSDGDLRYLFRQANFFKIDADYSFFRTVANPAAIARLKENENSKERKCRFDKRLLDSYLRVFHEMMEADGVAHIFYDMVKRGTSMHEHWESHLWPIIHCVRLPMCKTIESYIEELHDRRGVEIFLKHDGPQFYRRGSLETLNPPLLDQLASNDGILPITIDRERSWTISGKLLRDAVDFLGQLHYSQHMPDRGGYDDD